MGFSGGTRGRESTRRCRRLNRHGFDPWVRKIPWRRQWQPTLVFLPGKSHRQRSLEGYCPWGHKESDMAEWLGIHTHNKCIHEYTYTHTCWQMNFSSFPRPSCLFLHETITFHKVFIVWQAPWWEMGRLQSKEREVFSMFSISERADHLPSMKCNNFTLIPDFIIPYFICSER